MFLKECAEGHHGNCVLMPQPETLHEVPWAGEQKHSVASILCETSWVGVHIIFLLSSLNPLINEEQLIQCGTEFISISIMFLMKINQRAMFNKQYVTPTILQLDIKKSP